MRVPVLPFVDLLILLASACLVCGGTLKTIYVMTALSFTPLGLNPLHFVMIAALLLLLAIALTGRAWLIAHEPNQVIADQRAHETLDAYVALRGNATQD